MLPLWSDIDRRGHGEFAALHRHHDTCTYLVLSMMSNEDEVLRKKFGRRWEGGECSVLCHI